MYADNVIQDFIPLCKKSYWILSYWGMGKNPLFDLWRVLHVSGTLL